MSIHFKFFPSMKHKLEHKIEIYMNKYINLVQIKKKLTKIVQLKL